MRLSKIQRAALLHLIALRAACEGNRLCSIADAGDRQGPKMLLSLSAKGWIEPVEPTKAWGKTKAGTWIITAAGEAALYDDDKNYVIWDKK